MRRSVAIVFLVLVLLQPAASNAAPERTDGQGVEAFLADLDADGLSDAFEARLRQLASSARVSVVVTFDGPGGVATARDAVGSFVVTRRFDLVRGFAATMTKAQAQTLAAQPGAFRVEQDVRVRAFLDSADADFGTERGPSRLRRHGRRPRVRRRYRSRPESRAARRQGADRVLRRGGGPRHRVRRQRPWNARRRDRRRRLDRRRGRCEVRGRRAGRGAVRGEGLERRELGIHGAGDGRDRLVRRASERSCDLDEPRDLHGIRWERRHQPIGEQRGRRGQGRGGRRGQLRRRPENRRITGRGHRRDHGRAVAEHSAPPGSANHSDGTYLATSRAEDRRSTDGSSPTSPRPASRLPRPMPGRRRDTRPSAAPRWRRRSSGNGGARAGGGSVVGARPGANRARVRGRRPRRPGQGQ